MESYSDISANGIAYKLVKPATILFDFVESFWMLKNTSDEQHEIVVLPDGRFDIIFSYSNIDTYHVAMMGLGSVADQTIFAAGTIMFAVSFKLLAIEYLLGFKAASLLNHAQRLSDDFWGVTKDDLTDFESFCEKLSSKMISQIKPLIDPKKKNYLI